MDHPFKDAPKHFLAKLPDPLPDLEQCWPWQGFIRTQGYGELSYQGKTTLAHRLAYELTHGPIPDSHDIDHVVKRGCTKRSCVNPSHLEAVDHTENMLRQGDAFVPHFKGNPEAARAAAAKSAEVRSARAAQRRQVALAVAEDQHTSATVLALVPAHNVDALVPQAKAKILRRLLADEVPIRNAKEAADILQVLDAMERLDAGQPTGYTAHVTATAEELRARLLEKAEEL